MQRDPISAETKRRGGVLFITIVVIFSFLLLRVLLYQTVDFDRYREKVLLQKTTETVLKNMRISNHRLNFSMYSISYSIFSVQVRLFLPFTCAKPVKPGRT